MSLVTTVLQWGAETSRSPGLAGRQPGLNNHIQLPERYLVSNNKICAS